MDGDDSAYFTIGPSSGILRASHVFDYELRQMFLFHVIATDLGTPALSSTSEIRVSVIDTNDHAPEFNQTTYEFWIEENQLNSSYIGRVFAVDHDTARYSDFIYSISNPNVFHIDPRSGEISVLMPLDREIESFFYLNVYATDTLPGVSPLLGTATVVVRVGDQNDNWPVINFPNIYNKTVYVSSQVPSGYNVVTISAQDADEGVNSELVFSLVGGDNQGLFSVDYETGVISTAQELKDYESEVLNLEIEVSDQGLPDLHKTTGWLEIRVNDSVVYVAEEQQEGTKKVRTSHENSKP